MAPYQFRLFHPRGWCCVFNSPKLVMFQGYFLGLCGKLNSVSKQKQDWLGGEGIGATPILIHTHAQGTNKGRKRRRLRQRTRTCTLRESPNKTKLSKLARSLPSSGRSTWLSTPTLSPLCAAAQKWMEPLSPCGLSVPHEWVLCGGEELLGELQPEHVMQWEEEK